MFNHRVVWLQQVRWPGDRELARDVQQRQP